MKLSWLPKRIYEKLLKTRIYHCCFLCALLCSPFCLYSFYSSLSKLRITRLNNCVVYIYEYETGSLKKMHLYSKMD